MTAEVCPLVHAATFPTKQEAFEAKKYLRKSRRLRAQLKLCGFCDCYHIVSKPSLDLHITNRAIETLVLVAHGFTNRQVAEMMGTAVSTTTWYIQELLYAFGANNAANLVAIAISLGVINPSEFVRPLEEPCVDAS